MVLTVDEAKILAMVVLGGGSFLIGMLPAMINRRYQARYPLLFTFMLCFGAGVLIATSIVHILTEVQESLPGSGSVYFCGGFFLMYVVDVVFHVFFDDSPGHSHSASRQTNGSYGTVESERESLLAPAAADGAGEIANNSSTGKFGLLFALSLHSFLEGSAIGVQDTSAKVLLLITAVACHKYVVGFSLGIEVCSGHSNRRSMLRTLLISMLIFSLGSMFGIALGMALVDFKELWSSATVPILQAVAGGTLLYITLSEVLPREKSKFHQRSKWAIVLQFLACLLGFILMTILNTFLGE